MRERMGGGEREMIRGKIEELETEGQTEIQIQR